MALDEPAAFQAFAPDWLDLATRLGGTSYFQTPDWVTGWWETIASRPPTHAAAWRDASGRLDALVVLSRDRERPHGRLPVRVPVYVNAGSGPGAADHCGWLVAGDLDADVGAWLSQAIGGAGLVLRNAERSRGRPPLPRGARVIAATACPRLALSRSDEATGASRSFVRQLQRFTRRLERDGIRFEWVGPGEVDERLVQTLFALHRRMRAQRGAGTSLGQQQVALHRLLAARATTSRGPAATVATRDGAIVGVLYGFWWQDTFAAYQWGWDPDLGRHSMGSVLAHHSIRFAAGHGARTFDFLRGAEPYKYRFGATDAWDETWLVPRGPVGAALAARYRARDALGRGVAGAHDGDGP